jgi:hypothetical protein
MLNRKIKQDTDLDISDGPEQEGEGKPLKLHG